MRRRDFITLFAGVAAVWPLGARAQQPDRKRRIGVLMNLAENQEAQAGITAFRQALEKFSWTDRRNVQIEIRCAGGDADRYRNFAATGTKVALKPRYSFYVINSTLNQIIY